MILTPDCVNGTFEALGGLFIFNSIRVLYNDKMVKGVSVLTMAFFMSWGLWNLYYYPSLDQWMSFTGGLVICVAQLIQVAMMVYYTHKNNVQHA